MTSLLGDTREASAARTSLTEHLRDVMSKPKDKEKAMLVGAAYLDPRFKDLNFYGKSELGPILEYLFSLFYAWAQGAATETGEPRGTLRSDGHRASDQQDVQERAVDEAADDDMQPAKRLKKQHRSLFQAGAAEPGNRPCVASGSASGSVALQPAPPVGGQLKNLEKTCRAEWCVYRSLEPIGLQECPLSFWRQRARDLPHLSSYAKLFLGTPSASASVERLFSIFGRVAHGRDNLDPYAAERLIVAHSNYENTPFT